MKGKIEYHAPSKINLFLDVLGKRPDGYHNIATVFLPVFGVCDRIRIVRNDRPGIWVVCNDSRVPCDRSNLCWQAAEVFVRMTRVEACWSITIDKQIPVAAGLGGGSSDAAATLLALNEMYGNILNCDTLRTAAASLGADVPYFLEPVPSLGSNRGDVLKAVRCSVKLPMVLVNPGFPISASWAYSNIAYAGAKPGLSSLLEAMSAADIEVMACNMYNIFEEPAKQKFPLLAMLLDFLEGSPGCMRAIMSGSGPTVFGVCDSFDKAQLITERVTSKFGRKFWTAAVCGQ